MSGERNIVDLLSSGRADAMALAATELAAPNFGALPPSMEELDALFEAPMIEANGMTEAAQQMDRRPRPLARCKPGTVGPAAGVALATMNEAEQPLAPGAAGKIVIRGPSVMFSYEKQHAGQHPRSCQQLAAHR